MAKSTDFYQPTTEIQPSATETGKGLESWSKTLQSYTRQMDNVRRQDVFFDQAQEGREAGESGDFNYHEPTTRSDLIYERNGLEAQKISLSNQIRAHALDLRSKLTEPGKLNENSGIQFKAQMNAYLNGVVEQAAEPNKLYIENMGQRYIDSIGSTVDTQAHAYSKSQLRFQLFDYIDGNMQMAQRYALQGDASGAFNEIALMGQIKNKVVGAVSAGYLPAQQAESIINSTQQQLQIYSSLGVFRNAMQSGQSEEALQNFMQNPPSDMGIQAYNQTLSMMNGMVNAEKNMQESQEKALSEQTMEAFSQVANGQISTSDPKVSALYNNISMNNPEAGAAFNTKMNDAALHQSLSESLRYLTPTQVNNTVDMMESKLDPNSASYQTQVDAINKAVAIYNNQYKQFKADTAAYAFTSPEVQAAIAASKIESDPFRKGGVTTPFSNEYLDTQWEGASVNKQIAMGAAINPTQGQPRVRILTKPQANNLASNLNSLSYEEQIALLSQLPKRFGQYTPIVMRDLQEAGLPISNQMILAAAINNPASTVQIINGSRIQEKEMSSLKHKGKVQTALTGLLTPYFDSLNNFALPSGDVLSKVNDQVYKQALYYMYVGKTTDPGTAAQMAYNDYFKNQYIFGGIGANSPIRIPVVTDPNDLPVTLNDVATAANFKMKKLTPDLDYIFYNQYGTPREVLNKQGYYDDLKLNSKWVTLPDDSGIVLTDKKGSPVRIKTNEGKIVYYEILFEDLRNGSTKMSQDVAVAQQNFAIKVNQELLEQSSGVPL